MNIDKLAKELEEIYENSCYPKDNDKCLALDEQELAVIHMCLEVLGREEGYDKTNYITKDLFILLKNRNLGNSECKAQRVINQPLKYKMVGMLMGYSLESMSELLLVYYALLILYANNTNTIDYMQQSKRNYFKVYAYFACFCPKTFYVLLFNEIYVFMKKVANCSIEDLVKYLESTAELWETYNLLMSDEKRIKITGELVKQFLQTVSYDENALFNNAIKLYDLQEDGFLAFDFMAGDTIPGSRYKKIINGIEYFSWYLNILKLDLSKNSGIENRIYNMIKNILEQTEQLKEFFCQLLQDTQSTWTEIPEDFSNLKELIERFERYCDNNSIRLIEV